MCHGKSFGLRICQAEARRLGRHFLDQKKVAKDCRCAGLFCPQAMFRESLGCAPLSFFCPTVVSVYQITPVGPEVRASLSLPRESDKERPGSKGRGPSAEGPPLRGRSALTGGPVPPCAPIPPFGRECELKRPTGTFLPFGTAQPSGGISISAARRAKEIVCQRGLPRSPVNLWPLSFDQESGDPGVGLLPDKFSNRNITHGTTKKESQR